MGDFVEVVNTITGAEERVPADWLGDELLGKGLEKSITQKIFDGELPTARDAHEAIDGFANAAGINLGDAKTKGDKIAAISAALSVAAVDAGPASDFPNPEVQLVFGDVDDQPIVPAARVSANDQDDAASSTKEN